MNESNDDIYDKRTSRRIIGDKAEDAVIKAMTNRGYRLVCRNFAVHNVGEIDCVFEKGDDIYITEVRSRRNIGPYPTSAETVDYSKRKKLYGTARYLIAKYGFYDRNITFLIGQVTHNEEGMVQNVEIAPF